MGCYVSGDCSRQTLRGGDANGLKALIGILQAAVVTAAALLTRSLFVPKRSPCCRHRVMMVIF